VDHGGAIASQGAGDAGDRSVGGEFLNIMAAFSVRAEIVSQQCSPHNGPPRRHQASPLPRRDVILDQAGWCYMRKKL